MCTEDFMTTYKIFNDPVYGFIQIPKGILLDLIDHPYFQRLRRIKQLGLTSYVYPGAQHTRFHHALGALHLMTQAIETLRMKGIRISEQEAMGAKIAILLHDIGHGPFSHALERQIVAKSHEALTLGYMELLNKEFGGALEIAIAIFKHEHPKKFLSQLVSGQLDMDRMDYLKRDSFFTGVAEGVIGHDRIIKMLHVVDNQLVVEEKGIYSIEKFLVARRLMYWQVYLHKAVIAIEQMLILAISRVKELLKEDKIKLEPHLFTLLSDNFGQKLKKSDFFRVFSYIDDVDILYLLKGACSSEDEQLSILSQGIINRKLFTISLKNQPISAEEIKKIWQKLEHLGNFSPEMVKKLTILGQESNQAYTEKDQQISILSKDGVVHPLTSKIDSPPQTDIIQKYFICYP